MGNPTAAGDLQCWPDKLHNKMFSMNSRGASKDVHFFCPDKLFYKAFYETHRRMHSCFVQIDCFIRGASKNPQL